MSSSAASCKDKGGLTIPVNLPRTKQDDAIYQAALEADRLCLLHTNSQEAKATSTTTNTDDTSQSTRIQHALDSANALLQITSSEYLTKSILPQYPLEQTRLHRAFFQIITLCLNCLEAAPRHEPDTDTEASSQLNHLLESTLDLTRRSWSWLVLPLPLYARLLQSIAIHAPYSSEPETPSFSDVWIQVLDGSHKAWGWSHLPVELWSPSMLALAKQGLFGRVLILWKALQTHVKDETLVMEVWTTHEILDIIQDIDLQENKSRSDGDLRMKILQQLVSLLDDSVHALVEDKSINVSTETIDKLIQILSHNEEDDSDDDDEDFDMRLKRGLLPERGILTPSDPFRMYAGLLRDGNPSLSKPVFSLEHKDNLTELIAVKDLYSDSDSDSDSETSRGVASIYEPVLDFPDVTRQVMWMNNGKPLRFTNLYDDMLWERDNPDESEALQEMLDKIQYYPEDDSDDDPDDDGSDDGGGHY
jgi:hypothetical protein